MAGPAGIALGAPGIYEAPESPLRRLTGVRMDVCGFVGVAPRGPSREPIRDERLERETGRSVRRSVAVAVDSWDDYRRLFGGFEGPGLLPYAVASFFEQGGRRAYVVRIVHDYGGPGDDDGVARARVTGLRTAAGRRLRLRARNEGAWGNVLRVEIAFATRPLAFLAAAGRELVLDPGADVGAGTLLRLTLPGGTRELALVTAASTRWAADASRRELAALLETTLPAVPDRLEVVEATVRAADGAGLAEEHARLGLSPLHPRFLGETLAGESELLFPDGDWELDLRPDDPELPPLSAGPFRGGADRFRRIAHEDFFDARRVPGDPGPADGVEALLDEDEVALVCVPDLYAPAPVPPLGEVADEPSLAGAEFAECVHTGPGEPQALVEHELRDLRLDPLDPADRRRIEALQLQLEELAEEARRFVCLLDVPPGLAPREALTWRSRFGSSYLAAYHPWPKVARSDDGRDALVRVPPSAFAAGIVARRERAWGVPYGPWNELAEGAVDVDQRLPGERHDELHLAGVNVFLLERDGVRLTAGRTLSRDPRLRQLSVRRLMTMLRLTLERQTQWLVFEPSTPALQEQVRELLRLLLRRLWLANAFRGASEEEAFFVRCDASTNPPQSVDRGLLVAEVGVAPAEPLEYLVLRVARAGDGTVSVEAP